MGFFKALAGLVSKDAWGEQYIENFLWIVRCSEKDHPQQPRCAHLARAWVEQFRTLGCTIESYLGNNPQVVAELATFFSCLNKPYDVEAIALLAVFECRWETYYPSNRLNPNDQFIARYRELARLLFKQMASKSSQFGEWFQKNNPNSSSFGIGYNTIGNPSVVMSDGSSINFGKISLYREVIEKMEGCFFETELAF
jgi:hypothetical protein